MKATVMLIQPKISGTHSLILCSCGDVVLHCHHYVLWQHFGELHVRSLRLFTAVAAAINATAIFQQAVTSRRLHREGGGVGPQFK